MHQPSRSIHLLILVALAASLTPTRPATADLVAYWNFNSGLGNLFTTGLPATQGAGLMTTTFEGNLLTEGGGTSINLLGGDSDGDRFRLASEGPVFNNGKSVIFSVSTAGLGSLVMTFAAQRNGDGFRTNPLAYSSNGGGAYSDLTSYMPLTDAWGLVTVDFSSVVALNNNPNVLIRITFDGATGTSFDNNYIDNIQFNASAVPLEACCLGNGACINASTGDCAAQGGASQGNGTTCAGLPNADGDASPDVCDLCDADPSKAEPGQCGCGVPDSDSDSDGAPDCLDLCPGLDDNQDCNATTIPDGCEIAAGTAVDCDSSGIPDECEAGQWIGADGGLFTSPANWQPDGVPTTNAILSNSAASNNRCVLEAPSDSSVCMLTVSATGSGRQILQINAGATLRTTGSLTIAPGGDIDLRGGELAGAPIQNSANSLYGFGTVSADMINQGRIEGEPGETLRFTGANFDNQPDGTLLAPFASLVRVRSAAVTQDGHIEVQTLGGLLFDHALTNEPGATITLLAGSLAATGLTNAPGADITGFGTIQSNVVNEGMITTLADTQIIGDLVNNGTIIVQNGILTITGNASGFGVIIGGFSP